MWTNIGALKRINSSFEFNFTWSGSPHGCCHVKNRITSQILLILSQTPTY